MILGIWATIEVIIFLIFVIAPLFGADYKAGYKAEFEMGVAGVAGFTLVWSVFMLIMHLI